MNIEKLPVEFIGSGEVDGFRFKQVREGNNAYIYQVNNSYYEVFLKRITAKCVDFGKRIYSDTEFKETYPTAKHFGAWAATTGKIERAEDIFDVYEGFNDEEVKRMISRTI